MLPKKLLAFLSATPRAGLLAAFGLGILFWGGFNTAIEVTNTESFCISCHEMRENIFEDFKKTIHYSNGSGIRASCPDCHVPKTWGYKVMRKIGATNELFHHLLGSVSTKKKFEEKRLALAESVWATMERTDSLECRNCHHEDSMDLAQQRDSAQEQHRLARDAGKTCIACHKGIAHKLPKAFLDQEHERFERDDIACWNCHSDIPRPAENDGWD